jgi:hypothetical protein
MRVILKLLMTVVAGVALGLLATWLAVGRGTPMGGDVRDGPWRTSLEAGSAQSGAVLRASVALHGLLALNRSETVYYSATTDGAGGALDARCAYRVTGRDPPARWWSITAYGADDYLIPNLGISIRCRRIRSAVTPAAASPSRSRAMRPGATRSRPAAVRSV